MELNKVGCDGARKLTGLVETSAKTLEEVNGKQNKQILPAEKAEVFATLFNNLLELSDSAFIASMLNLDEYRCLRKRLAQSGVATLIKRYDASAKLQTPAVELSHLEKRIIGILGSVYLAITSGMAKNIEASIADESFTPYLALLRVVGPQVRYNTRILELPHTSSPL
jgi:hypothetical protein